MSDHIGQDCDRSIQSENLRFVSLRNCQCRFESADFNGWVAPARGVAQRVGNWAVFEGNVQVSASAQ